jgi:hypothetical protein
VHHIIINLHPSGGGGGGGERAEVRGGRRGPVDDAARVPAHPDARQGTQAWLRPRYVPYGRPARPVLCFVCSIWRVLAVREIEVLVFFSFFKKSLSKI